MRWWENSTGSVRRKVFFEI